MWVVKYRKIWFALSGLLFLFSVLGMWKFGFNLSIDFKGGAITEVKYLPAQAGATSTPTLDALNNKIATLNFGGFSVRPSGESDYIIRTKELRPDEATKLSQAIGGSIVRQDSVGPVAGAELQSKAMKAVAIVILMIVLFVTFAFRKVSKPVSSWKYGLATIIALVHDVMLPLGIFVFLGYYHGYEIDLLFVTGLLAILGYSVHDTIVVFDRVRENLRINQERNNQEEFSDTVGRSVSQTFGRSINTSLTIFIVLLALYLVGAAATKEFALLLIVGLIAGTYSSIFIASPLLVTFYKLGKKKK